MTAWDALKAASSLAVGTAWALITSPKAGGSGLIVNDGVFVEVAAVEVTAEVADVAIAAEIQDTSIAVEVLTNVIEVEVAND